MSRYVAVVGGFVGHALIWYASVRQLGCVAMICSGILRCDAPRPDFFEPGTGEHLKVSSRHVLVCCGMLQDGAVFFGACRPLDFLRCPSCPNSDMFHEDLDAS